MGPKRLTKQIFVSWEKCNVSIQVAGISPVKLSVTSLEHAIHPAVVVGEYCTTDGGHDHSRVSVVKLLIANLILINVKLSYNKCSKIKP